MHTVGETTKRRSIKLPPLKASPRCTIIIPCYNEEAYIEATLSDAQEQTYPPDRIEILVVDGGSTDATRAIVGRIAALDSRISLIDNPARIQAAAMNVGIQRSSGDVIVRMDAHAEYARDYVEASVAELRRTGALNVGGAARPRAASAFQRVVCAALSSPLGVGGSAYRDATREGFVESVFNGAFRREVFEQIGLFDPGARTNEDAELNQRIIEAGGKVYLSRAVVVHYYPRGSLRAVGRQYLNYGRGRARTMLRRRRLLSVRPVLPCAMVTTFALLGLGASISRTARVALLSFAAGYAGVVAAESVRAACRATPPAGRASFRDVALLGVLFPTMHVAHGIGLWVGLFETACSALLGAA